MTAESIQNNHGNRLFRVLLPPGQTEFRHDALLLTPPTYDIAGITTAAPVPPEQLPAEVLRYTLPSRYCESDKLLAFAWETFGNIEAGWPRVRAICDWVHTISNTASVRVRPIFPPWMYFCADTAFAATSRISRSHCAARSTRRLVTSPDICRISLTRIRHRDGFPRVRGSVPGRQVVPDRCALQCAAHRPRKNQSWIGRSGLRIRNQLRSGILLATSKSGPTKSNQAPLP